MSQFIDTTDKRTHSSHQLQAEIIKGIFSKICNFTTSSFHLTNESSQKYFKKNLQEKLLQQQQDAQKLHHLSMMSSYHRVKQNLSVYGRSKSHKLEKLFDEEYSKQKERQENQKSDEIKRLSVKPNGPQRVVFLDRKYNQELVTKTAMLSQLQQISKIKNKVRKARSMHNPSPLLDRVRRQRNTYNQSRQKTQMANPVLQLVRPQTLKKKKKAQQFFKRK